MASYYPDIGKKILVAVASMLNDIRVPVEWQDKRIPNGATQIFVDKRVPIKISTAQKMIIQLQKSKEERDKYGVSIPMIGVSFASMDPDEDRAKHPMDWVVSNDYSQYLQRPYPYDFTVNVGIIAGKTSELLNISEQILPRFRVMRAFPLIEFRFLDGTEVQRDLPIIVASNSIELADETAAADQPVYKTEITLKISGHIYMYSKDTSKYAFDGPPLKLAPGGPGTGINGGNYVIDYTNYSEHIPYSYQDLTPTDGSGTPSNLLKPIRQIDIDFENKNSKIYESLEITEQTGEVIDKTMTAGPGMEGYKL